MPHRPSHARPLLLAAAAVALALAACDRGTPQLRVTTERAPAAETPVWTPPPSPAAPAAHAPAATAPRVVALDPPDGASDVDPMRSSLTVTFDRAMDREGWSWVIEGPETAPELGEAGFDAAARANTVQARLQPGRTYVLWVNSPQYSYFRSAEGIPAQPVRWTFTTRAAPTGLPALGPAPGPVASHGGPPHVVRLDPPNGAIDVDPATALLRATFDRPMEAAWSWVTEGSNFPEATGRAYFEPDARTAAMPVRLQPGRTYVVWLNSREFQHFRDLAGVPAPPLRWTFSTRPVR